jgi:two-component system chemotaxis response regulator CheY
MDSSEKDKFYIESLEIIENILAIMAKKELEINELYQRLEEYEKRSPRTPLDELVKGPDENRRFNAIVAESIAPMRRRIREILGKDCGCDVVAEASTGRELIAYFMKHRPHLIVADIELPTSKEGYDALKQISSADPDVRIIVISRELDEDTIMKVTEIGAFDLITKPINHMRLIRNVERLRPLA